MKRYSAFPKAPASLEPSDCLVSYQGHSWGGESYLSAEVQSVYSTAPADWATVADLKVSQMNVQCNPIQEIMIYKSE